jgi:uncharacterized protein (DUF1697 family)
MARVVALLRGINVGGHRKVPMARLREVLEAAGFEDVATYVQSGNVVLTAPARRTAARVGRDIEAAIEAGFGFPVDVVVRTRDELAELVAEDPLGEVATDPSRRIVVFLAGDLDPGRLEGVRSEDFAPEAFTLREREIVMWAPEGQRDSRLVKTLTEKRTGVLGTARNWRTVEKLLAMADAAG